MAIYDIVVGHRKHHHLAVKQGFNAIPKGGWGGKNLAETARQIARNEDVRTKKADVSYFLITDSDEKKRLDRGDKFALVWTGEEGDPESSVTGITFAVGDESRFFVTAIRTAGRGASDDDGLTYLHSIDGVPQSSSLRFQLMRSVNGRKGPLANGNKTKRVPVDIDGRIVFYLCNFVNGESQPFTYKNQLGPGMYGVVRAPFARYKSAALECSDDSITIVNVQNDEAV